MLSGYDDTKHLNFTIDLQQWQLLSFDTEKILLPLGLCAILMNTYSASIAGKKIAKTEKKVVQFQGRFYKCEEMGVDSFMATW